MVLGMFVPRVDVPCRTADPELFFHPHDERGAPRRERRRKAQAVCARCPVTSECLRESLHYREEYGTWGGVEEQHRRRMWRGKPEQVDPEVVDVVPLCRNRRHPIDETGRTENRGGRTVRFCSACRRDKNGRDNAKRHQVRKCVRGHVLDEGNLITPPGHRRQKCRTCWDAGEYATQQRRAS